MVLRFPSLNQAQRVPSPSHGLSPQEKAWVNALLFSTKLSLSHRRVAGSHYKTRLGFTLCLSPTNSALLLDMLQTRTAGQSLGLRIASLHEAHRFSSPCRGLEPQEKAWVYALPLSTWLCVSPRRVAGTHRRARVGSMFCLSPPGSACLLAET